ncbi:MAG: RNA polymerase sigma factor [Paracoccus sp. (in: a-proteobacteria)]|uniref:RNA polymerase sigma factor n=1 Tax=Paracoccus sp. TaxID=267 RepID=UPI0026E076B2|nr:RNA polymerase sigma factor [Paracoccus sp. (in: a-proteobacteria)]MDO5621492.1 RNA polymerase sigma factor [Paracoccus sp. (in: a-proteobacteria)]
MPPEFSEELIRLLPNLRRFALSLARRADVADDLVQTTVEKALANWASFDTETRMEPWLFRILRNAFIDLTRRDRTRGTGIEVSESPEILPHDSRPAMEARLMLQSAQAAMLELPEEQREVLHLVCIEELSYADTAEALGIPKGTVMSRLSRARLALAEKLGIN